MFIDAHCHIDRLENSKEIIERARKNNVKVIVSNGTNKEINREVLELAKKYKEICPALGIYPIEAIKLSDSELKKEFQFIKDNVKNIGMIGEVGMDFKEDLKEHKKQEKVFREFIKISIDNNLPITVHSRKAEQQCIEILEEMKAKKVIMHYFSGKKSKVERILKNNWFLTIPTCVAYVQQFQDNIKLAPIENLLCETDSPYSHPEKKFPNEPANILASYKKIAEIKGLSLKEVEKQLEKNWERLTN